MKFDETQSIKTKKLFSFMYHICLRGLMGLNTIYVVHESKKFFNFNRLSIIKPHLEKFLKFEEFQSIQSIKECGDFLDDGFWESWGQEYFMYNNYLNLL